MPTADKPVGRCWLRCKMTGGLKYSFR